MFKIKKYFILVILVIISTTSFACAKDAGNVEKKELYKKKEENDQKAPLIDKQLLDQNGKAYKLEDLKGKTVFLNFFSTECHACMSEIDDIEKLYQNYGKNKKDVVVIGVVAPQDKNSRGFLHDRDMDGIKKVLSDMHLTFPVLFDKTGEFFLAYGVRALPTTFILRDNKIQRGILGALTYDKMESLIH